MAVNSSAAVIVSIPLLDQKIIGLADASINAATVLVLRSLNVAANTHSVSTLDNRDNAQDKVGMAMKGNSLCEVASSNV